MDTEQRAKRLQIGKPLFIACTFLGAGLGFFAGLPLVGWACIGVLAVVLILASWKMDAKPRPESMTAGTVFNGDTGGNGGGCG